MKLVLNFLFSLCLITSCVPLVARDQKSTADTIHFVVIIPSYNNKEWYKKNLDSVFCQTYSDFEVMYIADAPTDGTDTAVEEYFNNNHQPIKRTLIKNEQRKGALCNLYTAIGTCNPHDVIVTLDGDDWLADEQVLAHLHDVYSTKDVWMTYGQSLHYPSNRIGGARQIPAHIINTNAHREYEWVATHLRTFYAGLFQRIHKEDLMYENTFYSVTWDLAFMFPMLEMAGTHSCFIDRILYVYNCNNPISDFRIAATLQGTYERHIRSKPRYLPLESLNR